MRAARFLRALVLPLAAGALLGACATPPPAGPPLVLFGELHDQPDQQRQVAEAVRDLAAGGRLAALVIEMADAGRDTRALPRDAGEAAVREALGWSGWPWETYADVVMAAVRAGVPVAGGNLPRAQMRAAVGDASLDARVPAAARDKLVTAVRDGHCGLLPAAHEPAMVRVQIARDLSMARTLQAALATAAPGQQVLLLAGAQHVSRDRGVPLHLGDAMAARVVMFGDGGGLSADELRPYAAVTRRDDPCETLRRPRPAS